MFHLVYIQWVYDSLRVFIILFDSCNCVQRLYILGVMFVSSLLHGFNLLMNVFKCDFYSTYNILYLLSLVPVSRFSFTYSKYLFSFSDNLIFRFLISELKARYESISHERWSSSLNSSNSCWLNRFRSFITHCNKYPSSHFINSISWSSVLASVSERLLLWARGCHFTDSACLINFFNLAINFKNWTWFSITFTSSFVKIDLSNLVSMFEVSVENSVANWALLISSLTFARNVLIDATLLEYMVFLTSSKSWRIALTMFPC